MDDGLNKEMVWKWLNQEAARLERRFGIRITGGTVRTRTLPSAPYAMITGMDFTTEDGAVIRTKSVGIMKPLEVVGGG